MEVIAAIVSVLGTGLCGITSYVINKKCDSKKRPKKVKDYLKHRLFNLSYIKPLTVPSDRVREKLFEYIQNEILINSVQNTSKEWIIDNSERISNINDNYSIGRELILLIDRIESAQHDLIISVPPVIQNTVNKLLCIFYTELKNMISIVNFENHDGDGWIMYILDFIHLIILNTINHWRVSSNQINGSLNGIDWNGETMKYSWCGEIGEYITRYNQIWKMFHVSNIIGDNYSSVITDDKGLVIKVASDSFHKLTEYNSQEIEGENCNVLQLGLNPQEKKDNYSSNSVMKKAMFSQKGFNVRLMQRKKESNDLFYFNIFSIPVHIVYPSNKVQLIHIAVQVYSDDDDVSQKPTDNELLNLHTVACCFISCAIDQFSVITICSYDSFNISKLQHGLCVLDVYNNNLIGNGLVYKKGINLTEQIDFSMSSFRYIMESFELTLNSSDIDRSELIRSVAFKYSHENIIITAEVWILDKHVVISHRKVD